MKIQELLMFIDQYRTHADYSLADSVSAMIPFRLSSNLLKRPTFWAL